MASKNECIIEGRLGQDPKVGTKWTNEEQLLLCQMIENKKTNVYIAKILGRSYGSVCHKIYQLGKAREKGVNQTFFGIPYSMQGKHHTDDTKLKIGRKARERLKDKNRNPHWKGGRVVSNNGYMTIYFPDHPRAGQNKHVFEHIVIMETILQRQLEIEECVHHINGNRLDNRPENLMLFKTNSDHQKYHAFFKQKEWEEYEQNNSNRKIGS